MKRAISSCVFESTLAIAPVASGTSASVESAAAPCHKATRRFGEAVVLVESVISLFHAGESHPALYNPADHHPIHISAGSAGHPTTGCRRTILLSNNRQEPTNT